MDAVDAVSESLSREMVKGDFRKWRQLRQFVNLAAISASAWRAISARDIGRDSERICGIYVVKLCELSVRYIIVILCKLQGTG